ncbi:hypothetical protein CW304_11475 [Bacillus sp. UFRGS-B20]|nr:hypothetical protein CW304_11475 [Bacillus sp. UFRGS-B20]
MWLNKLISRLRESPVHILEKDYKLPIQKLWEVLVQIWHELHYIAVMIKKYTECSKFQIASFIVEKFLLPIHTCSNEPCV